MMKIIKYFFAAVGVGVIAYICRDALIGFYHNLHTFAQLSFWQWVMIGFILFNLWLWKNHHRHPALEVLWKHFSYAYKVIALAFALEYIDNKFFRNKDK